MNEQEMEQYIELNPFRGNEPIFRGTKITVNHIINDLANGMNFNEILKQHSQLSHKHLQAVFVYCKIAVKENETRRVFGNLF